MYRNTRINESNGGVRGNNNIVYNNIFYGKSTLLISEEDSGAMYNVVKKNIFSTTNSIYPYSSKAHYTILDSNIYINNPVVINNRITYTIGNWKTFSQQDLNSIIASGITFDISKSPYDPEYYKIQYVTRVLNGLNNHNFSSEKYRPAPPINVKAVVK